MTMVSVLIVGAGPAGLATASAILENNSSVDVTVVDKKLRAGEPPQRCAGGIRRDVDFPVPSEAILAKTECIRLHSPDGNYWDFENAFGYVLDREIFERKLAERAEKLGAELVWNYNVTVESLSKLKREYDYVVGADGYPSVVAKWVGAEEPPLKDIEHCIQKTVKLESHPQNRIDIYFGRTFVPDGCGYAWLFPKGAGEVRAGLGVSLSSKLNVKSLLDFYGYHVAYDLEDKDLISRLLPLCPPRKSNVFLDGKVLLVGDAGLWTDASFGSGIPPAIYSGRACGKAIAEGKPYLFDKYVSWLRKENQYRYKIKRVLTSFSNENWNDMVRTLNKGKPAFTISSGSGGLRAVAKWVFKRKPRLILKFLLS
jgi:flavin-dependent dehydrogenase